MSTQSFDLRTLFELWVDSPLKVQIVTFYHRNPGLIETVDGLAQRIGADPEAVRKTVADHVKLGFLKERALGNLKVIVYDPSMEKKIQEFAAEKMRKKRFPEPAS
jgi:hypothetical protein